MIILKKLKWANWFSYGEDNEIDFTDSTLTQILGINGAGKSSIPLILEEVLFGKNSKGIKKSDIPNWNLNNPNISASLYFEVDNSQYEIHLNRKSTIKLSLIRDGEDISYHTATQTYKAIEEILGLDHKTFSPLVYQSTTSSLKFLTATDATRKAFLIALFDLNRYTRIFEDYKAALRERTAEITSLQGSLATVTNWIDKYSKVSLEKHDIQEVPEDPEELRQELAIKLEELANIKTINAKINANNTYKKMLEDLDPTVEINGIDRLAEEQEYTKKKTLLAHKISELNSKVGTLSKLTMDVCSECMQPIDQDQIQNLVVKYNEELETLSTELVDTNKQIVQINKIKTEKKKADTDKREFESLWSKIDQDLPTESLDANVLASSIEELRKTINRKLREISDTKDRNAAIVAQNNKVDTIKEQLEEHKIEAEALTSRIEELSIVVSNLTILKKAFSTTGLISYKLEYLVKDLEATINKYLAELSTGKFLIDFALSGDKLLVNILYNGQEVSIQSLSTGQLARVNTATLLAIRKLMSSISKTKINLLFLDETLATLDTEGRDTLIDMLLEEKDLNTFLVSHEYQHPLLAKVEVYTEDGISHIKNG